MEADPAAAALLAERAGEDRLLMRREAEKLALYVGPKGAGGGGRAGAEEALAVAAEGGGLGLGDALMAATAGDVAAADRALDIAFAEGANAVQAIRAALQHIRRLQAVQADVAKGKTAREAMQARGVFFRDQPLFERALRRWSAGKLESAGTVLLRAERQSKTTGLPDETLARHAILAIARA